MKRSCIERFIQWNALKIMNTENGIFIFPQRKTMITWTCLLCESLLLSSSFAFLFKSGWEQQKALIPFIRHHHRTVVGSERETFKHFKSIVKKKQFVDSMSDKAAAAKRAIRNAIIISKKMLVFDACFAMLKYSAI